MAFAGGVGADLTGLAKAGGLPDAALLFSESQTRFIVEVTAANAAAFEACVGGLPLTRLGQTCKEPRLRIAGADGAWVVWAARKGPKDLMARAVRRGKPLRAGRPAVTPPAKEPLEVRLRSGILIPYGRAGRPTSTGAADGSDHP